MAHELWRERFTQDGRSDAWHKLGTHFDPTNKDLTLADVVHEAGADFQIEVHPLTIDLDIPNPEWVGNKIAGFSALDSAAQAILLGNSSEPQFSRVSLPTGQNAIVRLPHFFKGQLDSVAVLGTGSDRYVPVQNMDIAAAFEQVAKIYRPATCGVLLEGKIFFLTLDAGQFDIRVNGHDDQHNAYIYLFDTKTPGSKLQIGAGATRVVCWNTLNAAEGSAKIMIPLQHAEGIDQMIAVIAKALEGLQSSQKAMRDAYQQMADKTLSYEQAQTAFRIAWPDPKLSQTILSLDTLTNPVDSPNLSQVDLVANAIAKVNETQVMQDKINKAKEKYAADVEVTEWLRETASASLMHMADAENLGINGFTAFNAVSETLEHRSDRIRGNVAQDMLVGERSRIMDRVYKHLLEVSQN